MSLASDCAKILRLEPASRIDYVIEGIVVNKSQMEKVAKAIDAGDVAIVPESTGSLGAAYSSFASRTKWDPGERKIIGKISIDGGDEVVRRTIGKAAIFHESVHALVDVARLKMPSMQHDEVMAYIADAMYLRAMRTSISGGKLEMAIYDAAFAIVDARKMLTRAGTTLKWTECEALYEAIKAYPLYQ
ncbi:MAG: hypothetical protein ABL986_14370 [Vicinamibacterales bacterium]